MSGTGEGNRRWVSLQKHADLHTPSEAERKGLEQTQIRVQIHAYRETHRKLKT
jgi:hypothetical protein